MTAIHRVSIWVMFFVGALTAGACADGGGDLEPTGAAPDFGPFVPPNDIGPVEAGPLDAGPIDTSACAACSPPRDGLFCGYTFGCGSAQPAPACHFDGSGDASLPPELCGCDGRLFRPMRYGGQNGNAAADRPFGAAAGCGASG